MTRSTCTLSLAACGVLAAWLFAPAAQAQSRGELLYTTHCIACHTEQMHWRTKRLANDWNSLAKQVRRWQGNAGLAWSEEDILEVTGYVNARFYRFAPPRVSQRLPQGTQPAS